MKRTATVSDALVVAVDRDARTVTLSLDRSFEFQMNVGDRVVLMENISAAIIHNLANGGGEILGARVIGRGKQQ